MGKVERDLVSINDIFIPEQSCDQNHTIINPSGTPDVYDALRNAQKNGIKFVGWMIYCGMHAPLLNPASKSFISHNWKDIKEIIKECSIENPYVVLLNKFREVKVEMVEIEK